MSVTDFLSGLEPTRKEVLTSIHQIIIDKDKSVDASIGKMMGNEMIIYSCKGTFKYGLSSVKNHMSLHLMPIYSLPKLHEKYAALLSKASFQKGCINFKSPDEIPLPIVKDLLAECATFDFAAFREAYLKSKKVAK